MKIKEKQTIFSLQIRDEDIVCVKIILENSSYKIASLEKEQITSSDSDEAIAEKLKFILNKTSFNRNNKLVICIPRYLATVRYLDIPSNDLIEIENIIKLQKSSYLPHQIEELVYGYDILKADQNGYSKIALYLVPKNLINRYLDILKSINFKVDNIILSSYGFVNWYKYFNKEITELICMVVINLPYFEFIVISKDKLIFSRAFKAGTEDFLSQMQSTLQAYEREKLAAPIKKIILIGKTNETKLLKGHLGNFSIEEVNLDINLDLPHLIGITLSKVKDSLNFIPPELKEENRFLKIEKEIIKFIVLLILIFIFLAFSFYKNINDKSKYLEKLETQSKNIGKDIRDIEITSRIYSLYQAKLSEKPLAIDIISEIYKIIPSNIILNNLSYQEKEFVILKGTAMDLSSISNLVNTLGKSAYFKNVNLKYVNKQKNINQDSIEFEIACLIKVGK